MGLSVLTVKIGLAGGGDGAAGLGPVPEFDRESGTIAIVGIS